MKKLALLAILCFAMGSSAAVWAAAAAPAAAAPGQTGSAPGLAAKSEPSPPPVVCGTKKTCDQMTSCEEATAYLNQCQLKQLDKDNDGVPCESLCKPKKPKK